jgi:excinuclease ABC subunit A
VKIATELSTRQESKHTVYILDEPTTGLHLADIERLLASLNTLVDAGIR